MIPRPSVVSIRIVTFTLTATCLLTLATTPFAIAQASRRRPASLNSIQHFVFLVKENRSFDHYFGTYPGANGATTGKISTGQVIPLAHMPDAFPRDFCHDWDCTLNDVDGGRMDKFDVTTGSPLFACNVNGDYLCFTQATQADIPNYFAYAGAFTLADNMFSSMHGTSYPNHMYTVAAQSAGITGQPTSALGCDSNPGAKISVLDSENHLTTPFPCFELQTVVDSLAAASVTWKFYAPFNSPFNPLDAVNHVRYSDLWSNVVPDTQFVLDAAAGNLPAVSWLVTSGPLSEHPGWSACEGENWTVQQINAIMQGPDWDTTAIFLAWDDFDGLYDHVPPPKADIFGLGPRVPLIIISPYSKAGKISHTQYEFSSFLKIVEERYGLSTLTARDAAANDMLDSFDFTQTPLPPLILNPRACSPASTTAVTFLPQAVGTTSQSRTVTLANFAPTPLNISSISLPGGDFSQVNNCPPSLAANQGLPPTCLINVLFTPLASGPRSGTLTITDDGPTSSETVNLAGTGTNISLTPSLLSFGTLRVGTTATLTSTLANLSPSAITITSIVASGDYTQTNTCGTRVPAGKSCVITVSFTPSATGVRYATVTIADSDGSSPQVLNLTGSGTFIALAPSSLTFSAQAIGTSSAPQTITLTNRNTVPLKITGIQMAGNIGQPSIDFTQTNTCHGNIPAGGRCQIRVTFVPTIPSTLTGSVEISDAESATSPQAVSLSGIGIANAVPLITPPLVPTQTPPAGATFTLTVNGTGFVFGSTVNWNGTSLATTFTSSSELQATVPSSNLALSSTAMVTVVNPSPGGGSSNALPFQVMNRITPAVMTRSTINVGKTPQGLAAADFNRDRLLDLAVTNSTSNTVTVLTGNGDGTFSVKSTSGTGTNPVAVATGDFNGDNKADLAIANSGDSTITILLGNGDGTFTATASTLVTGAGPVAIAVADFNRDGRLDLAVANSREHDASIFLGNGDGTFMTELSGAITATTPHALAAGDFNGDGFLDLAVANQDSNSLTILLGNGDGSFTLSQNLATGNTPSAILVADFNGDGKLDLASANQGENALAVLLGNGDGTFTSHSTPATGAAPVSLVAGDFDGDGKLDLAVSNSGDATTSLLLGNGDGTFQPHLDSPASPGPAQLVNGDFNQDGKLDLAVPCSTVNAITIQLQASH